MGAVVAFQPRLPMPEGLDGEYGLSPSSWRVLTEQIFPKAKSPQVVLLAVDYCRSRKLDIMKKPVHIVSVYDSDIGQYVEQVWPGINEVQTTAARTGEWAGLDEPIYGPLKTITFKGEITVKGGKKETIESTVTFPEWCKVTVYRLRGGIRCPFSVTLDFIETMVEIQQSGVPNSKWTKKPKTYLSKCTKAAALRAAFPEEIGYCAEEMEGRDIGSRSERPYGSGPVIDQSGTEVSSEDPADQGWVIQHPETGVVIDTRTTKPETDEIPKVFGDFIGKVLDRYRETGAEAACLSLFHQRLAGNFEALHVALFALASAIAAKSKKAAKVF